jgi:carbon starvation protein
MKVGTIGLLAVGILVTLPTVQAMGITQFAVNGQGPVFAGSLFPFVFITIACGALSGFHALISSGTTPKMIQKEAQVRFIGYGGMLTESFVAVMALIAAVIIEPGLYYAMNSPAGLLGDTVESASAAVANLGFTITPEQLTAAAAAVEEETLVARTGGAPTLAVGMAEIFSGFLGGDAVKAFWYHFAIMFEALFILTTVDAGTRVGRFMLQDTLGNIWKPIGRTSWKPGLYATSAIIVGAWGYFLYAGVTDPLGGIYQLFPLFGIANQLLAAIALTVATTILIKSAGLGRRGHPHRELAKGVFRRSEARLLRPAGQVRGRAGRRAGVGSGEGPGRDAAGRHERHRGRHPGRGVRAAGRGRDRGRRPHLDPRHPPP